MSTEELTEYRERLLRMREAITALEDVRKEGSAVVELDQARTGRLSRMDALQLQAMAHAGRERAEIEIRRIDAALARIEAGSYGECVECGDEIGPGRLAAHPAVALCLECAQVREARRL